MMTDPVRDDTVAFRWSRAARRGWAFGVPIALLILIVPPVWTFRNDDAVGQMLFGYGIFMLALGYRIAAVRSRFIVTPDALVVHGFFLKKRYPLQGGRLLEFQELFGSFRCKLATSSGSILLDSNDPGILRLRLYLEAILAGSDGPDRRAIRAERSDANILQDGEWEPISIRPPVHRLAAAVGFFNLVLLIYFVGWKSSTPENFFVVVWVFSFTITSCLGIAFLRPRIAIEASGIVVQWFGFRRRYPREGIAVIDYLPRRDPAGSDAATVVVMHDGREVTIQGRTRPNPKEAFEAMCRAYGFRAAA